MDAFMRKSLMDWVLSLLKDPPPKVILLSPRSPCGLESWWTHLWLSGRREMELVWVWLGLERFVVVQSLSRVGLFVTPWTAAGQAPQSFTISWRLLKLMSVESMPYNPLILFCPLLLLPSVFPSIRVFSSESALRIRWPKDWSFSFIIDPSNEYSGLERMIISKYSVSDEEEIQGCPGLLCVLCPSGSCSKMLCLKRPSWPPCGRDSVCLSLIYFSRTG